MVSDVLCSAAVLWLYWFIVRNTDMISESSSIGITARRIAEIVI